MVQPSWTALLTVRHGNRVLAIHDPRLVDRVLASFDCPVSAASSPSSNVSADACATTASTDGPTSSVDEVDPVSGCNPAFSGAAGAKSAELFHPHQAHPALKRKKKQTHIRCFDYQIHG